MTSKMTSNSEKNKQLQMPRESLKNQQPTPIPPEISQLIKKAMILNEIADPCTEPPRRLEIGDELEHLGDSRSGIGLNRNGLPDIDWVKIPAGPFKYQKGEMRDQPDFWVSRFPITNRQFQAFVDAGGYKRAEHWQGLIRPKPEVSKWPQGNRPRTNVDWYEAVAFTRWLTARLRLPKGTIRLPKGTIRLPTELEWEKVARGTDGQIYPWDNQYLAGFANIDETYGKNGPWYLTQTTAVGLYPHGCSPYGVEDLAGTVLEWCLNKLNDPEVITTDMSDAPRVMRGGSWGIEGRHASAIIRDGDHPDCRGSYSGFRVVSSAHHCGG